MSIKAFIVGSQTEKYDYRCLDNLPDDIASEFSSSVVYKIGDYVIHDGSLYRFTANHAAGEWIGTDAVTVRIGEDLLNVKKDVAQIDADLDDTKNDMAGLKIAYDAVGANVSEAKSESQIQLADEFVTDVILNGPATALYDGTAVIDGVNIKITSTNGRTDTSNFFMISAGQVNKANGGNNFIADTLPVNVNADEVLNGRANSSAIEIRLLKTRCEYTVAAANAWLKDHPIRLWFPTPNFSTATGFYYNLKCEKTGSWFSLGNTQPIPQLSSGDTLSFRTGEYHAGGNSGNVSISGKLISIPGNSMLSSVAGITVKTLINLSDALDKKIDINGWNEVVPINTAFFDGLNYFDINKTTIYNDRFVNNSGQIVSSSDITSIVFPVKSDTKYWFYASGMNRFFVVENSEDSFNIGSTYTVLHNSSETTPTEFTTGYTARYVCAYIANYTYDFTQNSPVLNEKQYNGTNNPYVSPDYLPRDMINPLSDANVLIFGDSITDTCNFTINAQNETTAMSWKNPSNSYVNDGGTTVTYSMWPKMLRDLGVCTEVRNYARSGASYKDANRTEGEERQNLSYQITVALNDLDNPNNVFTVDDFVPDIVIFALGTNDGTPNDTYADAMAKTVLKSDGYSIDTTATLLALDKTKFCEAARYAFLKTRIAFPNAQFYCVLPIQRANNEANGGELNAELRKMAERYGCVIVNGFAESGIIRDTNVWNALGETLKDGLHPNDKGQNMLFRAIYGALRSHYIVAETMNP